MRVALLDDPEWRATKDEMLRRIGCKHVLSQKTELLVKTVLSNSWIKGHAQGIERKHAGRMASVAT